MKKNIGYAFASLAILAVVGLFIFWDKLFPSKVVTPTITPPPTTGGGGSIPSLPTGLDRKKMLSVALGGSVVPEVKELQKQLNARFGSGLVVDGYFGAKTEAALVAASGEKSISLEGFAKVPSGTKGGTTISESFVRNVPSLVTA